MLNVMIAFVAASFGAYAQEAVPVLTHTSNSACDNYQAWQGQSNPRTDASGYTNHAYPEANATYWTTTLNLALGSVVTIKGQFPLARYMALQVYDSNRNVLGAINDVAINPDAGQNNPFRGGTAQGSYTVQLVFGRQPPRGPAPNTIYTANQTSVGLIYRVYYANNPNDLPGGTYNPVLPNVIVSGSTLTSCPVQPIITPEDATVWGRLDNMDYAGTPLVNKVKFPNPPLWTFSVTSPMTPYYPSQDNAYLSAFITRDYLKPPYSYQMLVIRMRPPTFADTQAGVAPYAPANVRFWSMCQDEPMTTMVVRCVPDDQVAVLNGFVTFVISDPGQRPSDSILNQWGASWISWGALEPGDVVYDINLNPLTNSNGVFYNGMILYRQTMADPAFAQSIANVAQLPTANRQAAMGDYWPVIGYCTAAQFQALGAGCIGK